ncbi:hypothetical protein FOPG_18826 [Fusarium oxysporum f. sp. conglutinans race 2 54008]|uniref:Uncharacterized protein n=1 Tax=Fusarium oxysporum f. sp. conglutinans race 2 54008 TaxID=1089457 RepID=X0GYF5_FUSOX|nr:hypothetical protein FOPG_18826 [Fusarium oxysporum f. sp. conglutinans race 2 54008]
MPFLVSRLNSSIAPSFNLRQHRQSTATISLSDLRELKPRDRRHYLHKILQESSKFQQWALDFIFDKIARMEKAYGLAKLRGPNNKRAIALAAAAAETADVFSDIDNPEAEQTQFHRRNDIRRLNTIWFTRINL